MFRIALQIKKENNILILRLPPVFRAVFLLFSIFLVFSIFSFPLQPDERGNNFLPYFFLIISIFITLYEEKWIFDKTSGNIEWHIGLVFFFSRETFLTENLDSIRISEIKKGNRRSARYLKMSLVFRDSTEKDIDIVYIGEKEKLKKNAELIAEFCTVSLQSDLS